MREAVIDGEAVVLGSKGIADFQALRRELGKEDPEKLTYYAFDLLWLNGKDLRGLPLVERKQRLRRLIDGKLGAKPRRIASLYLGGWEGDRLHAASSSPSSPWR